MTSGSRSADGGKRKRAVLANRPFIFHSPVALCSELRMRSLILGRRVGAPAALAEELVELLLVLGAAQALQEIAELALLLLEPAQCVGAIFVEGPIAAAARAAH